MVQHFYICIRFLQGHATYILFRLWHILLHHANIFLHCKPILLKMSQTHFLELVIILEMLHFFECIKHLFESHKYYYTLYKHLDWPVYFLKLVIFFRCHKIFSGFRKCLCIKTCPQFKILFWLQKKFMFQKVFAL